jgi:uncharacterized damage-inducible protein DinB
LEVTLAPAPALFLTTDALLKHWQAHRRLTRRVIDAFPEDKLFTFSIGGMRSFGVMTLELLSMAAPTARGAASGDWSSSSDRQPKPKAELLARWDDDTTQLDALWGQIPVERFQETVTAFGAYTALLHEIVMYVIDNEIHHRAQGFVYLRALGIEPPAFYDRS